MRLILMAAVALAFGVSAQAHELDQETSFSTEQIQLSQDLPKTVVVRTKLGSSQTEVLQSNETLKADAATKLLVSTSSFNKVVAKGAVTELDSDSSNSSWYFCFPSHNYYTPTYYYYSYSYTYTVYYTYVYAGYSYSYYRWPYGGGYYGGSYGSCGYYGCY